MESSNSKRSNIRGKIQRMDLAHGRNSKDISLDIAQERVQNSMFVLCESALVQKKTASNGSSPPMTTERIVIVDSGLHFRKARNGSKIK